MAEAESPPRKGKGGRPKGSTTTRAADPRTFNQRMAEYNRILKGVQLNDTTLLQNMVYLEIEFPKIRKKVSRAKDMREQARALAELSNAMREYRQVQSDLGLSRNQRGEELDMQKELNEFVDAAEKTVAEHGVLVRCQHCQSEFEQGVLLFHFRDEVPWRFQFICPKCGKLSEHSGPLGVPLSFGVPE